MQEVRFSRSGRAGKLRAIGLGFGGVEEQEEGDVVIKSNRERNPRERIVGRQRNDIVGNGECQVQQDIQVPGVRGVPVKRRGEV